ncbi:MAG: hypothetical protein RLN89_00680 [Parvibaculum sp.]
MKKFLAVGSVVSSLTLATMAPAQAGQTRGLDFEDILRALIVQHVDVNDRGSYRDQDRHGGRQHNRNWRDERQVIPIAQLVHQIQRDTGGEVTGVTLQPNGRFYQIEGVGRGGRFVTARANALTGEISNVQRHSRGAQPLHGKPIPRILRDLGNDGFYGFDRVVQQRGDYVVRGLNRRGEPVRIRVNARNGRVLAVNAARNYNGSGHLRQQVRDFNHWRPSLQNQHYTHFGQAVRHDDYYAVDARDRGGRNVSLNICARTGRVLQSAYR